jgi:hypothetical protein
MIRNDSLANMPSSLRVASVLVAVILYSVGAVRGGFRGGDAYGNTHPTVVCSNDHAVHDVPARWVISDWEAKFKTKHNEQHWIFDKSLSTFAFAKRLSCFITYAAILDIGFNRTDVIYPFHFFF